MPWCDPCDRFFNPNTLHQDGTCPQCGTKIATVVADQSAWRSVPWHFWLVVASLVSYLGWRAVQGFVWVLAQF